MNQFKNDTFGLVSRLLEKHFVNYRKSHVMWVTAINKIFCICTISGTLLFQMSDLLELS